MELLVKVGNSYDPNSKVYNKGWRDGQIVDIRPDGFFKGKMMRRHFCIIQTQHDYWDIRGTTNWKSTQKSVLDLKKYVSPMSSNGKLPWEHTLTAFEVNERPRRRDYFIDFKWLLDVGWINKTDFESIYTKDRDHNKIYLDRDIESYLFHEDDKIRLTSDYSDKGGSISAGTYTIGSAVGDDYSSWVAAAADVVALTGDLTLKGARAEELAESSPIDFGIDTGSYTLTCGVASGYEHNGGAYGNGHRISFDAYDYFYLNEDSDGFINKVIIQDLAVNASGSSNKGVYCFNGCDSDPAIIQRCLVKLDSSSYSGAMAGSYFKNLIIRNNIIYGADSTNATHGGGLNLNSEYSIGAWHIYNNTVVDGYNGIYNPATTPNDTINLKNNLCYGNSNADYLDGGGTPWTNHATNVSGDTTSPDGSTYQNWAGSAHFKDYANDDFRLDAADTTLDDGTDLSAIGVPAQFADDIQREARSTWYVGASEYVVTGGATAAISDTISLSEALTGIGKYKAAAIDSIGFGETVTPLARLLGTISDIVNLADTADVSSAIAGVIQDTLRLSDTLSALAGLKGSLTDTISLAESLTVLAAWKIAISDNIALNGEAKTNLVASVIDSLGLSDIAAGLGKYKSDITDTINFGDTASGLRTLIAVAVDSLDFVTSVTGTTGGLTATVLDTLGFSDSVAALGNYQVELVDGVDLNDATTALAGYIQSIIDTIGLSDTISVLEADGIVTATFTAKIPGATFTAKIPGITFTLN